MKLVLAGVMHSPNLGDGVIAACIDEAARQYGRDVTLDWLDLAGRTSPVPSLTQQSRRTAILNILDAMPTFAQQILAQPLVKAQVRRKLAPLLPGKFENARGVIIGGGQLLSDVHLNFPVKIARIVAEAEARDLPIALHGVGVAQDWTAKGTRLFGRLLHSPKLRFVSVRDEASRSHLTQHLINLNTPKLPEINVFPDPGLLAADLFSSGAPANSSSRPRVGLGITHPVAIRAHSSNADNVAHLDWVKWYRNLAAELAKTYQVILFTNGSPEDETMLAEVTALPLPDNIERLARVADPIALINFIGGLDGIAAHRLHALIVAYSLNVPSLGFRWDAKVDAFFKLTNSEKFLVDAPELPVNELSGLIAAAGQTTDRRAELRAAARNGVHEAISALLS
ncbi:polysaccharide pyruvyl transferase WcaK-like protein [Primorskyibacter sedentarius]|uniref:Polysaccharide pyruvyl transferase WcaK-like protein n=2 Tax=Primorskyibacter sedentarius TaxID=745311 RepID=A0A4R3J5X1_9RHOB|nr:polysaccharide pyruvyl transferase WcaK-like protein [Primorskyibacter sedentarius]